MVSGTPLMHSLPAGGIEAGEIGLPDLLDGGRVPDILLIKLIDVVRVGSMEEIKI